MRPQQHNNHCHFFQGPYKQTTMNSLALKLFLAYCAFGVDAATNFESLAADLEGKLGSTCEEGSIQAILEASTDNKEESIKENGCPAFTLINEAIVAGGASQAAATLLLERVDVKKGKGEADDFVDENEDFTFVDNDDDFDDFDCPRQSIMKISKKDNKKGGGGKGIGTRSEPGCVEDRVNEVEAIVAQFTFMSGNTEDGVAATDADTPIEIDLITESETELDDTDKTDAAEPDELNEIDAAETDELNVTDAAETDELNVTDAAETEELDDTDNAETEELDDTDATEIELDDKGISAGLSEAIGKATTITTTTTTSLPSDFSDIGCVNQTFALDKIPANAEAQDEITNSRRVEEQIFLINRRMLDYTPVNSSDYQKTCEANGGIFRQVDVTTLCKRRSLSVERILQRITYEGRNFPTCVGQKCSDVPDEDFHIIFAESLLNSSDFYDMEGEGEFWTCSGAFGDSLRAIGAGLVAAAWLLF